MSQSSFIHRFHAVIANLRRVLEYGGRPAAPSAVRAARSAASAGAMQQSGKVRFALDELNAPRKPVKARPAEVKPEPKPSTPAPRRRLPF